MYTRLPFTTTKIVKETHRKRDSENGMKGTNSLTIFSRRECSCIEQLMQLFDNSNNEVEDIMLKRHPLPQIN
jgi:hypothetical protein